MLRRYELSFPSGALQPEDSTKIIGSGVLIMVSSQDSGRLHMWPD